MTGRLTWGSLVLCVAAALLPLGAASAAAPSAKSDSACLYPASGEADGCAASPGGSEMVADLLKAYGRQLGRRRLGDVSMSNFPGVGYPVGVPARMLSALVDVDLAPISTVSTTPGFGILPKGCVKTSSTTINCNLPNGGTISGVNTAPNSRHGSVSIIFNGSPGGDIKIEYCNMEADGGNNQGSNAKGLIYVNNGSTASVTLYANTLDGHADQNSSFNGQTATINTSGRIVVKYNAFKNAGGRVLNGVINARGVTHPGDEDFENNLFLGMGYFVGGAHAEVWEGVLSAPSDFDVTVDNVIYKNNTCVQPATVAKSQTTACIYASTGSVKQASGFGVTFKNVVVDHNLLISLPHDNVQTTSAAVEFAYDRYINVTITNNVVAGPGSIYAFLCTGAPYTGGVYDERAYAFRFPPKIDKNVDLVSGDRGGINRIGPSSNSRFDQFSTYKCRIP